MAVDFGETRIPLVCEYGKLECYRFNNQRICRVNINDQVTLPFNKNELQEFKNVLLNGGSLATKPPEEFLYVSVLRDGIITIRYFGHYRELFYTECVIKKENIQPLLDFEWRE